MLKEWGWGGGERWSDEYKDQWKRIRKIEFQFPTDYQLRSYILVKLETPVFGGWFLTFVPGPEKEADCASVVNKWVYSIQPVGFANVLQITSLISLGSPW